MPRVQYVLNYIGILNTLVYLTCTFFCHTVNQNILVFALLINHTRNYDYCVKIICLERALTFSFIFVSTPILCFGYLLGV